MSNAKVMELKEVNDKIDQHNRQNEEAVDRYAYQLGRTEGSITLALKYLRVSTDPLVVGAVGILERALKENENGIKTWK